MRRISPTWLVVFAVVWWILAQDHGDAPAAGFVAVAAAVLLHTALGDRRRGLGSFRGSLRFLPFFLVQSVRGGWNVARTALAPGMPLAPTFVRYRTRIADEHARVFFLNTISLLPGTFSARLTGHEITVHLLTQDTAAVRGLEVLEERVAGAFGLELSANSPAWSLEEGQPPAAHAARRPRPPFPPSGTPEPTLRAGDGSVGLL